MIKRLIKRGLIDGVSISAVREIVNSDAELKKIWEYSIGLFPDLKQHYSVPVDSKEVEYRIRLLIAAETFFIKKEVNALQIKCKWFLNEQRVFPI